MFFGVNFLKQDVAKLVPDDILDAANLAKFQAEFIEVLYYFPEIMAHLARAKDTPGYMAYGHPNLNVDNGFFFQGLDGNSIEMGGLDWGGYGKMGANVFLSGAISNSEDNQYNDRHEQLCRLYCSEFSKHSGVQLSGDQVFEDFELMSCMKSLICCIAQFTVAGYGKMNELHKCSSVQDTPIVDDFYTRNLVRMTISSFHRWKHSHAHDVFKKFAEEHQVGAPSVLGTIGYGLFYWPWQPLHTVFMHTQVFLFNRNLLGATWGLAALVGGVALVKKIVF